MLKVRVRFSRFGSARYLAHLELNRVMLRAVARAELPIWFTEGFNPHPHLVFGPPLPVGYESSCEIMDFKIVKKMHFEEIAARLGAQMPEGIGILSAREPVNGFGDICYAKYELEIDLGREPTLHEREKLEGILALESLIVDKKSKKGSVKTDILHMIKAFSFRFNSTLILIETVLSAKSDAYLSPETLLQGLRLLFHCDSLNYRRAKRVDFLLFDGKSFE